MSELDHVLVSQLEIPAVGDLLLIELSAVRTFEINQVGLYSPYLVTILVPPLRVTKLYHRVLLAQTRVLGGQVHDCRFSPHEPAASVV